MARVIGHERIYKERYMAICNHCGAIILFDKNEVQDKYQYNNYAFTSGQCPECKGSVSFDKKTALVPEEDSEHICKQVCEYFKEGRCTYTGTDWKECIL